MKAGVLLISIGMVVLWAGLGCTTRQSTATSPGPHTSKVEISYDDLLREKFVTRDITLAVGDTLTVTLASNPSTGFRWTAETQIGDASVVQQTSHVSVGPTSPMVGAPGAETWTFRALNAGTTTISTEYSQPWPGGVKADWTFKANVAVH